MNGEPAELVERMAAAIRREEPELSHGQAKGRAELLLKAALLAIQNALGESVTGAGGEEDEAARREAFWADARYWDAIDPNTARIMRNAGAAREEIEDLVPWGGD